MSPGYRPGSVKGTAMAPPEGSESLDALRALHAEVDARAAQTARRNAGRLQCGRGCADCCRDGLEVFEIEAENIRQRHAALLATQEPHPKGACAFLADDKSCRIYAERPYVCRTQGLPLRWIEDADAPARPVERRDICPLNLAGPALEELAPDACWELGPVEGRLAALQRESGTLRRVGLRDLFRRMG